ncbi:unnamed protein product [Rotaria sp. Silwood2]|nr:unnamed protein product [Rotaria sp. Silwood2]CAF3869408.1 unnamed protein product [Rotaria sp. Silwood2]CAF4048923.1 unnamed protein product [Rotaria sp. Silwood2]
MSTIVQNTTTSVRRLYVLLCGFEILPKTVSTRNLGANIIMSEPISAYLLDTTEAKKYFVDRGWTAPPVVLPVHRLKYQLSLIGVEPEMINYIILTHTHADHTGNLKYFPNAKIYIQRQEYEYAFQSQEKLGSAWFRDDYDNRPETDWFLIDGDMNIVSGLDLISTRGHTSGHQSVRVLLPSGTSIIMTGDAGDLLENYEKEILPGESVDDIAALESIRRLNQLASLPNTRLFLCHDPILIQTLKLAPDYYN